MWGWLSKMCQKIVGLGQRSHGQTQVQTHEFIHGGKRVMREARVKTGNQSMSRENKLDSVNMGGKKQQHIKKLGWKNIATCVCVCVSDAT